MKINGFVVYLNEEESFVVFLSQEESWWNENFKQNDDMLKLLEFICTGELGWWIKGIIDLLTYEYFDKSKAFIFI